MGILTRLLDSDDTGVEMHILLTFLAVFAVIGFTLWAVLHGQAFNGSDFGDGIGKTIGGGGLAAIGQGWGRKLQNNGGQG